MKNQRTLNEEQKLRIKRYQKEYRIKNREKIKLQKQFWEENNKIKVSSYKRKYYVNNKDSCDLRVKNYYKLYPEKKKGVQYNYSINNKPKIAVKNKRLYDKYKLNPEFRIDNSVYSRVRIALNGILPFYNIEELLGCDISFLKTFLESKFQPGMSWENYGKWHIDHIIPCASFNFNNPLDQLSCFHYTNLQPLWALDNIRKGNTINA